MKITGTSIKTKRAAAGISGYVLCRKLGITRNRLTNIERGYVVVEPEYLTQMDAALADLIRAQTVIQDAAAAAGWPVTPMLAAKETRRGPAELCA